MDLHGWKVTKLGGKRGREVVSVKSKEREKDYDNISLYEILKTEKNTTLGQHP